MIEFADIIVDLQAGDTGKGKVAHSLAKEKNKYTHVVRYNGGGNAGHTIYHNGVRYVTYTTQNHAKVFLSIMETAYNYPNDEIRVIVHTGTLEGFDLEKCWIDRVNAFKYFYQRILLQTSSVYFDNKSPVQNRVKLYGVLPSVSSMHDLDKVILFDTDGSLYQKIDGEKIPAANRTEKEDEQLAA